MDVRRRRSTGRPGVLPLGLVGDGALRAAIAADREVTRMEGARMDHLASYLADCRRDWVPPLVRLAGAEELVALAGQGAPEVPDLAVCEVSAGLGISQAAASSLCADVLDLTWRLPQVAAAVRSGELPFAKARLVARRTRELSMAQVAAVQAQVMTLRWTARGPVPVAALVPVGRLQTMVDQAVLSARAQEEQEQAEARVAQSLFVELTRTEGGATDLAARLASGDAVRLDRRLTQIAARLAQVGDGRSVQVRRAVALALLADPALLRALEKAPVIDPDIVVPDVPEADTPLDLDVLPSMPSAGSTAEAVAGNPPDPAATATAGPPRAGSAGPPALMTAGPPGAGSAGQTDVTRASRPDERLVGPSGIERWRPAREVTADPPTETTSIRSLEQLGSPPALGVAGLPPGVLDHLAGLVSTVLYVHLDAATRTWCEERAGALTEAEATALLGHSRVTVRPVLDLAQNLTYTGYQAPTLLREQLAMLNAGYCTFPSCHRKARVGDVDHQNPYPRGWADPADGGATETRNTHLLCRRHHRAKTHQNWDVYSPAIGTWVWTSPAGARWLVTQGTTTSLDAAHAHHDLGTSGTGGAEDVRDADDTRDAGDWYRTTHADVTRDFIDVG